VETRIDCWVCEMDGGPYGLIIWIYVFVGGMRDQFAGMWAWLWL